MMMFEVNRFIADCRTAMKDTDSMKAVREVVQEAVSEPGNVIQALGEPTQGGVQKIHHSDDLTIINVFWAPRMTIMPHNHNMAAVIGVYSGREDNIFWRRIKDSLTGQIEAAGADSLGPRDAVQLGKDIIHSVTNPTGIMTGAIHVYAGDFFEEHRSEWDPENLSETDYDIEKNMRLFEEANARLV
jgi:predicted metal-dependent enzyme (double-stranded beta helix superfamily)